jgi:hypothetical protein
MGTLARDLPRAIFGKEAARASQGERNLIIGTRRQRGASGGREARRRARLLHPYYTFADPESCRCLYVGRAKEYATYQQLALQHEVNREIDAGSESWRLWGSW